MLSGPNHSIMWCSGQKVCAVISIRWKLFGFSTLNCTQEAVLHQKADGWDFRVRQREWNSSQIGQELKLLKVNPDNSMPLQTSCINGGTASLCFTKYSLYWLLMRNCSVKYWWSDFKRPNNQILLVELDCVISNSNTKIIKITSSVTLTRTMQHCVPFNTSIFKHQLHLVLFSQTLHYKMCCVLLISTMWAYCLIACCWQPDSAVLRHLDPFRLAPLSRAAKNQQRVFLSGLMLHPEANLMTGYECQLTVNHSHTALLVHTITVGITVVLHWRCLQLIEVWGWRKKQ